MSDGMYCRFVVLLFTTSTTAHVASFFLRPLLMARSCGPRLKTCWTLAVQANKNIENKVESYAFFSDFDSDHYQTLVEDLSKEDLIPSIPISHCAINPTYDLSSPYISPMNSESTFLEYTEDGLCIPAGPVGRIKEEIANLLTEPAVEIVIASVILLNSLLVALSTLESLSDFMPVILFAETVVSTIFVVDFAARWFSSNREPGQFVLDPQFAIDMLVVILPFLVTITPDSIRNDATILPSALSKPSELFNLRLLRVLRLQRFLRDLETFERFIEQVAGKRGTTVNIIQEWQLQLARVVSSLFTLLSVVSGLIYTAESSLNPNISNYFDALYFTLTTLTTVGFGDVSPVTWQGKLIVCASIVFGIAIVPAQAASLVEALLERERGRNGKVMGPKRKSSLAKPESVMGEGFGTKTKSKELFVLDTAMSCRKCGASFHWSSADFCYSCGAKL